MYYVLYFFTISTTSIIKLTCSSYALKSYTLKFSLSIIKSTIPIHTFPSRVLISATRNFSICLSTDNLSKSPYP